MARIVQIYMTIGAIFGVILAGPLWYAALFHSGAVPSDTTQIQSLLMVLLYATIRGVLRAFAWLPSVIYHVGMLKMPFTAWLFGGWW